MWWHVNKGLLIGAVHKRGEVLLLHTSFCNIFLLFPPVELREPQGNICSVFQNSTCLWCVTKAQDWSWLRRIFLSAKCGPWLFLVQVEVHPNRSSWKYIYIYKNVSCLLGNKDQRQTPYCGWWCHLESRKINSMNIVSVPSVGTPHDGVYSHTVMSWGLYWSTDHSMKQQRNFVPIWPPLKEGGFDLCNTNRSK